LTSESSPGRGIRAKGDADAGLDVFYNPTPLLRANVTVNTDFAQTEVDQRQVNLTRFNLFFPEKRDFFLDGAPFFDFASPGGDLIVNPFFSRNVGLGRDGTPQPIDVGTKLTGQVGGQDVGLLHVRTGDEEDDSQIGEDFTVARLKRRMLRQSYVGALYTRRDARGDRLAASNTGGIDLRLATSTFLGSQNLEGAAWFLHASRPGVTGRNNAFGASMAYPNDRWDARLEMREVQPDFNPSVGFVTRRNYRRYQPQLTFGPRPNNRWVRRYLLGPALDVQTDLENNLLLRTLTFNLLETQLQSQDTFAFSMFRTRERLDAPFAIARDIVLPAGAEYEYSRFQFRGQTANRRVLAMNWRYEVGDFYSGTRRQSVLGVTLRARPGYILYLNAEWNEVHLAEGRFASNLFRIVGETQFTPFVALVNNLQFDTVSRVAGWQSRFRWIVKPGNDLYVVYTHNWLEDPVRDRFATLDRRFASKVLYTHRF